MTAAPVRIAKLKEQALAGDAARAEFRRLALAGLRSRRDARRRLRALRLLPHLSLRNAEAEGACRARRPDRWRSSRMMPRSASRLTLAVTGVRAEPPHAISADDAEREGLWRGKARRDLFWLSVTSSRLLKGRSHKAVFAELWDSLYGRGAWDHDPPVEHRNVDEMCEAEWGGER